MLIFVLAVVVPFHYPVVPLLFACWVVFMLLSSARATRGLHPDQDQGSVGPDLDSNCKVYQQSTKIVTSMEFVLKKPVNVMAENSHEVSRLIYFLKTENNEKCRLLQTIGGNSGIKTKYCWSVNLSQYFFGLDDKSPA